MTTPAGVARRANVTSQTIRNYSTEYAQFLSPGANPQTGNRVYTDEDVELLCAVAALRRSGMSRDEVTDHLRAERAAPTVIDVTPQTPSIEPQAEFLAPQIMQPAIVVRFDALERRFASLETTQTTLLRAALLWGVLLGAIGSLTLAGFVVWVLWLTGN